MDSSVSFVFGAAPAGAQAHTGSSRVGISMTGWRRRAHDYAYDNSGISSTCSMTDGLFPLGFQYVHRPDNQKSNVGRV
jgi:hypothetical protein